MVSDHPAYVPPLDPEPDVVMVTVNVTVIETTSQIQTVIVSDVIDRTQTATLHVTPTCAVSNVISIITLTQTITETTTSNVISSVTLTETMTETTTSNVTYSVTVTETLTETTTKAAQTSTYNISLDDAAELAEEYRKNLTVDNKQTSSYIRSKTSAEDERKSSQTMGALGLLMVIVPLGTIIILDLPKIWFGLRSYNSVIGLPPSNSVNTVVKFESDL